MFLYIIIMQVLSHPSTATQRPIGTRFANSPGNQRGMTYPLTSTSDLDHLFAQRVLLSLDLDGDKTSSSTSTGESLVLGNLSEPSMRYLPWDYSTSKTLTQSGGTGIKEKTPLSSTNSQVKSKSPTCCSGWTSILATVKSKLLKPTSKQRSSG